MSEQIDDKAFDEYLGRQSPVSRQYRGLEALDVPPDLDRRVLDQAAQAVEKQPGKARVWKTWGVPVALAASVVLTLAVVIESEFEPDAVLAPNKVITQEQRSSQSAPFMDDQHAPQSAPESETSARTDAITLPALAPAPAPIVQPSARSEAAERIDAEQKAEAQRRSASREQTTEQAAATVKRTQPRLMDTPVAAAQADRPEEESLAASAPAASESPPATAITQTTTQRPAAPPPPPQSGAAREAASDDQAPTKDLSEIVVTGERRRDRTIVGPRGTLMRPAAPASAESDSEAQRREADPARWLDYIRELRRDRKSEEADREWREFRQIYPDYAVEEADSARPER